MQIVHNAFPGNPLFPYVDRFWSWEVPANGVAVPVQVLPGTGSELQFHFSKPPVADGDARMAGRFPSCHLTALRSRTVRMTLAPGTGFLSIRFRAGALRHFCDVPMGHVLDTLIDAHGLWGNGVLALREEMAASTTFEERVRMAGRWLLARFRPPSGRESGVDWAVRRMYYHCAGVRLDDLMDSLGLGVRQFQRLVGSGLGMGPKEHVRLSRFQRSVKAMLLYGRGGGVESALEGGFYDQSHFIKDFKRYVGLSPRAFLRGSRGVSHFYKTSRPDNAILKNTI